MILRHGGITRRDAILLLIGASSMQLWSLFFAPHISPSDQSIVVNTHVSHQDSSHHDTLTKTVTLTAQVVNTVTQKEIQTATVTTAGKAAAASRPTSHAIGPHSKLPRTKLLAHAPGWTLFKDLYMSNGTIFIVADESERMRFPEIRMMTSTGLEAENTPENIAAREPTTQDMSFISYREAVARWGAPDKQSVNRVWTVEGNTMLFNDPKQFLRHYYHFVAELWFGVQAFWHGAFSQPVPTSETSANSPHFSTDHAPAPPIHRAIFIHSNADGWRDDPGFNSYFLRAALPSITIEHEEDWNDRVMATRPKPGHPEQRAWHFPLVLFTDRSAAHRGPICGSQTQRTAAEAWDYMRTKGKLRGLHVGGWWAPIREAIWRFAGAEAGFKSLSLAEYNPNQTPMSLDPPVPGINAKVDKKKIIDVDSANQKLLPVPDRIIINYISRQGTRRRKLIPEDHDGMVEALEALVERKNKERELALVTLASGENERREDSDYVEPPEWEFNEIHAERLTKDQQIQVAAESTFMLGVHGNGLTHLVFMEPNRYSTVIEIFYPGGFAHDYQWTTRALGMSHFAVWNDTHHTYPNKPKVEYPEGFQGNEIPVYGPTIAQLIEDRVDGKL
ncbi:hypothetical protein CVT24_001951 [Panaeolus cyanescens]|uniref:Glycosyltransferase 61 catalytic domain-containing protein n=1 Tax=Panaeolus cyanescens TaxID=181874 RepID=A0A409YHT3_9AGAR|nr:hypothetical protein CVT24_001951 [Panaeolus cyanescens]